MTHSLWSPTSTTAQHSYMAEFMHFVNLQYQENFIDYKNLYEWSIQKNEYFWEAVWNFCDIKYSTPPQKILQHADRMQDTEWFIGAKLNFAENLLKRNDEHIAIIAITERNDYRMIQFDELNHYAANLAHKLRSLGLKPGDRVAAILPNIPEAVIAMLATTSIGAIWSSCSPDFGVEAIINRFGQIEPTILITVDGHFHRGKNYLHNKKNETLQQHLPSIKHTLFVRHLDKNSNFSFLRNTIAFEDCLSQQNEPFEFCQLPFSHPLYILYSSGTTGKPKCMVHGAGRTLLQHLKELMLHTNVSPNRRIFFYTTTAWMMWNWLVSSLAIGTSIVLYEGDPLYPHKGRLFDLIDEANITIFGLGAKFFELYAKDNLQPKKTNSLSTLETILTTGSPLLPASFDYVYQNVKSEVQLSSISGGSDIISCFALGNPLLPVYRGELQCRGLGMDVKIFDEKAQSVIQKKGELVCTSPFPSMPICFWNDPDGRKYQKAYFEKFPNVWTHGDYAMLTKQGGMIIFGRSDTTLNPGGVRIGSAEIYEQIEKVEEVLESAVIGQEWKGDERIILFVVLKSGASLDENLKNKIKSLIQTHTTPYHVPEKIIAVNDIPRTPNGKIAELTIKKIIHNEVLDNTDALTNPGCIEQYRNLTELRDN